MKIPTEVIHEWVDSMAYTMDYSEAYKLAQRASDYALEQAAMECDRLHGLRNDECADKIRALKSSKAITDSAKIRAAFEDDDLQGVPV